MSATAAQPVEIYCIVLHVCCIKIETTNWEDVDQLLATLSFESLDTEHAKLCLGEPVASDAMRAIPTSQAHEHDVCCYSTVVALIIRFSME